MEDLFTSLPQIARELSASAGVFLLLDFDGTLCPIIKTPALARLSETNKALLKKISRLVPTAIVSGRALSDIKRKVGLRNLVYSGNHGLEWQIDGRRGKVSVSPASARALRTVCQELTALQKKYPGSVLENKGLTLSFHYRLVQAKHCTALLREAEEIVDPFERRKLLQLMIDKKTLEIRPAMNWHKGFLVDFLHKKFGRALLPIYIGDAATDEDVFKTLRSGITIKVGRGCQSAARFQCSSVKQVTAFLSWLKDELEKRHIAHRPIFAA